MCSLSLEMYSRAFFADYFAEALLGLCSDAVPNIRLRLCRLMPQLRRAVRVDDKALRLLLNKSMHALYARERDDDVIAEYKKVRFSLLRHSCCCICLELKTRRFFGENKSWWFYWGFIMLWVLAVNPSDFLKRPNYSF